ncbi:YbdD/YjiX family protein [Telmatospirillum siberiense]|uniref:DUF466 domain-containing protein n=1 Tax=Telmatospirillum siberiense TaxID=382514 RepID=A0A2N3PV88_9PROT|nr:YbdD/YjiX family protein [Telmatospirillum siberiense]PKU24314.1 hypothetical protein CWS72_12010 [Telmatospirillum siberiense]
MREQIKLFCCRLKQTGQLMIGVPDYDVYVEHRKITHPGEPIMSYEEFFRERQENRYSLRVGRCC